MKRLSSFVLAALVSFPALANEFQLTYECTRFKSKCIGTACRVIHDGLINDTERSILKVRKTQIVEYVIDPARAVETIKTELAGDLDRDQSLVLEYRAITHRLGQITLSNHNSRGQVTERVTINTETGLYGFYLLHTDGSIKDVPVGEAYTAYFGWCENKSPAGSSLPETAEPAAATPAAIDTTSATVTTTTATSPSRAP
ncbi:MAG: hypothetical protein SFW63_05120 [Alphaproteobacteria bacterium]|nr:hypothetical protein [Alphaproteobacteria bacterium]